MLTVKNYQYRVNSKWQLYISNKQVCSQMQVITGILSTSILAREQCKECQEYSLTLNEKQHRKSQFSWRILPGTCENSVLSKLNKYFNVNPSLPRSDFSNSPNCLLYNSHQVGIENLVLVQLMILYFIFIVCSIILTKLVQRIWYQINS